MAAAAAAPLALTSHHVALLPNLLTSLAELARLAVADCGAHARLRVCVAAVAAHLRATAGPLLTAEVAVNVATGPGAAAATASETPDMFGGAYWMPAFFRLYVTQVMRAAVDMTDGDGDGDGTGTPVAVVQVPGCLALLAPAAAVAAGGDVAVSFLHKCVWQCSPKNHQWSMAQRCAALPHLGPTLRVAIALGLDTAAANGIARRVTKLLGDLLRRRERDHQKQLQQQQKKGDAVVDVAAGYDAVLASEEGPWCGHLWLQAVRVADAVGGYDFVANGDVPAAAAALLEASVARHPQWEAVASAVDAAYADPDDQRLIVAPFRAYLSPDAAAGVHDDSSDSDADD